MKIFLFLLLNLTISIHILAYDVSGMATNSETGEPLSGFDILLTYTTGGIASGAVTEADGSFTLTDVMDGTYNLEFSTYPDPIILDGDYFLRTIYDGQVTVDGGNITGIDFSIPPHHPDYTLTGALFDAVTNDTITIQDFEVRAKLQYYIEFFTDFSTENGTYILEDMPDWTYEFNIFENDYYEGVSTEITIDSLNPDTVVMNFYLQSKSGVTVSGVLLDSVTNQPILQAGRSIRLQAINSLFAETNDQGEFSFINVPPGIYADIRVTSQDTSYWNCSGSEISAFNVPEEGVSNVQLYQKPWISLHQVTADNLYFEPGETGTIKFSIVNDDLSYGAIWGVNLYFPDGVTVQNLTPFYSSANNEVIFDEKPDCGTGDIKAWEGWHWIGIPPYASSDGNLDVLNESAYTDVTLEFDDDSTMETLPIFYEIFYDIHCYDIQPFSYGTIMMVNDNTVNVSNNKDNPDNQIISFPNPADEKVNLSVSFDKSRNGEIRVYDLTGQIVISREKMVFPAGNSYTELNTSQLKPGLYFYTFLADDIKLSGKLVISK